LIGGTNVPSARNKKKIELPLVTNRSRSGETNVSKKLPLVTNRSRSGETNVSKKSKSDELPHVANSSWTGETNRLWKNIEIVDTFDCMLIDKDGTELTDCFLEYPKFDDQGRVPFRFETLYYYQREDRQLQDALRRDFYHMQRFGTFDLICLKGTNRIVLSDTVLPLLVRWYHLSSVHMQGMDRLEGTIKQHFYHPKLREEIRRQLSPCQDCQLNKRYAQQYGALAPREAISIPWQEVHIDSIGPWRLRVNKVDITIQALTMIDPVTNLLEIAQLHPPYTALEAFRVFENTWLSRYPRPVRCLHDNGPEFRGHEFQFRCLDAGIEAKPTTASNPQSNGIVESVHRSIGVVLRTLFSVYRPVNHGDAQRLIEQALATAMHATRCAAHSSLARQTPGGLVFRRDMYLDIPLMADIIAISNARQQIIDQRLLKANFKRIPHEFIVGEQVLKRNLIGPRDKLRPTFSGPHRILQVHTNGSVTIQLDARIRERINIRRLQPFRRAPLPGAPLGVGE
jgi:Integrase zinc binding domain